MPTAAPSETRPGPKVTKDQAAALAAGSASLIWPCSGFPSDVTGRSSELRDTSSDSVNDACRGDSHLANTTPERTSATTLEELPQRIRDIATLRGLGYTFREISKQFEVTPQAISLMLSRHRRVIKKLRGAVDLAGLSPRAVNVLGRHGIRSRTAALETDVLGLLKGERNCGNKTLEEIRRWLADAPCAGQEVPTTFAAR